MMRTQQEVERFLCMLREHAESIDTKLSDPTGEHSFDELAKNRALAGFGITILRWVAGEDTIHFDESAIAGEPTIPIVDMDEDQGIQKGSDVDVQESSNAVDGSGVFDASPAGDGLCPRISSPGSGDRGRRR